MKCKDMDSDNSLKLFLLLCVKSLRELYHSLHSIRYFCISGFVANVHTTHAKVLFVYIRVIFLFCVLNFNIISLRTCFSFWWSGLRISEAFQSFFKAHILQASLGELVIAYSNSFFLILSCKTTNIVTVWKVSKYGEFLARIFPHSDWIRRDL